MRKFTNIGYNRKIILEDINNDIYPVEIEDDIESSDVVKFFSKLFESKEMAHVYHLQVNNEDNSLSIHEALDGYYKNILELIDSLIETYQGQYGIVSGYEIIDTSEVNRKEPVMYFEDLAEYIKHARKCIETEDSHLHSIIDDICILLYKTLYKLKFMK